MAPALCALALAYFLYHAVEGDRGLLAYLQLQNEIAQVEANLKVSAKRRVRLERRVRLMRPDGLDRDILAEQARKVLGLVEPGEVVIYDRN